MVQEINILMNLNVLNGSRKSGHSKHILGLKKYQNEKHE